MLKNSNTFLLFAAVLVFLAGCNSKPIHELILADTAIKAAQKAKADSLATDLYRKAENNFLRAKQDYREGYYDSCRNFADTARQTAEQAEYQALLKQSKMKGSESSDDYGSY
ncbi:MAG: DUF4398 domain-containing protein [Bdellovibrionales bacterium]|nr:DUF4398 domain-containing protein [Bdellovibrionales bacterium]